MSLNAAMESTSFGQQLFAGKAFPGYRTGLLAIFCFPLILWLCHGDNRLIYVQCGSACLLSAIACLSASYRTQDEVLRWRFVALSQAVGSVSYFSQVLHDYALLNYLHAAVISNLASSAEKIILISAIMGSRVGRGFTVRFLDFTQIALACAMLMCTLGSGRLPSAGPVRVWTGLLSWVVLSLLAISARFLSVSPGLQWFYVVLSRFFCWTTATIFIATIAFPRLYPDASDALTNFVVPLPNLLLCLWTIQTRPTLPPGKLRIDRAVVDSAQFSLLMLCGIALALFAFRSHPLIAAGLVLTIALCYSVRTQAFYSMLHGEGARLRSEADAYHQLATRDPLTGIGNRRWFETNLERRIASSPSWIGTLLLIDTDGFKQINDSLGHQAGDHVLCLISEVLQREAASGENTCISRIGGDEFAVLLPGHASAMKIAERIRAGVEELAACRGYQVTVSIGATRIHEGATLSSLMRQADEAMYRVKAAGRNGVQSFGSCESLVVMQARDPAMSLNQRPLR